MSYKRILFVAPQYWRCLIVRIMARRANQNHPQKGSLIKVEPIRDRDSIETIKHQLADHPRDFCLFVFGINTAFRANEILSIKCGQVSHLHTGDLLELWQSKTGKRRAVPLNNAVIEATQNWLDKHPNPMPNSPLFQSRLGGALRVSTVSNMVKNWCKRAGLKGNYASHSMRKTWGFHQAHATREPSRGMIMPRLMKAFGHSSEAQTMSYLCIGDDEVADLFLSVQI